MFAGTNHFLKDIASQAFDIISSAAAKCTNEGGAVTKKRRGYGKGAWSRIISS